MFSHGKLQLRTDLLITHFECDPRERLGDDDLL